VRIVISLNVTYPILFPEYKRKYNRLVILVHNSVRYVCNNRYSGHINYRPLLQKFTIFQRFGRDISF